MISLNEYIEKYAMEIDVEKERELIKKVQQNPNDALAWKQLNFRFKPVIQKAISSVGVYSNVNKDTLEAIASKEFKRSILNFDASKDNKPSTYITNNIVGLIRKTNDYNIHKTYMPPDLTQKSPNVYNAKVHLKSMGIEDPTAEQLKDTISSVFKKDMTISEINRIQSYTRDHYSSNLVVGSEDTGNAETFGDINFQSSEQPMDEFIKEQRDEELLNKILNSKLSKEDRDLFMESEGLGKYKNKGKISMASLAFNNNLGTAWEATKRINKIKEVLRNELLSNY